MRWIKVCSLSGLPCVHHHIYVTIHTEGKSHRNESLDIEETDTQATALCATNYIQSTDRPHDPTPSPGKTLRSTSGPWCGRWSCWNSDHHLCVEGQWGIQVFLKLMFRQQKVYNIHTLQNALHTHTQIVQQREKSQSILVIASILTTDLDLSVAEFQLLMTWP